MNISGCAIRLVEDERNASSSRNRPSDPFLQNPVEVAGQRPKPSTLPALRVRSGSTQAGGIEKLPTAGDWGVAPICLLVLHPLSNAASDRYDFGTYARRI